MPWKLCYRLILEQVRTSFPSRPDRSIQQQVDENTLSHFLIHSRYLPHFPPIPLCRNTNPIISTDTTSWNLDTETEDEDGTVDKVDCTGCDVFDGVAVEVSEQRDGKILRDSEKKEIGVNRG